MPKPLDLTNNNRVRELLEERQRLSNSFNERRARWKQIADELKAIMGEEHFATLPGWRLEIRAIHRKERTVPASVVDVLFVTPDDEEDE